MGTEETMFSEFILRLKKIKSKLPLNGDWLFVTEDMPRFSSEEKQEQINDLSLEIDTIDKVLSAVSSGKKNLDIIYGKTKEYENFITNGANLVRDKAKTLLSTASFVSAILFGSSTFLLSTINELNFLTTLEVVIYLLIVQHFVRALVIAMHVMTKEEMIYMPPQEFIELSGLPKKDQLKNFISRSIVYANSTDKYVWKRSDQLIKGQHAFRYGLIFSAMLLVIHLGNNIYKKESFNDDMLRKISSIEQKLDEGKIESENYTMRKIDSIFLQNNSINIKVDTISEHSKATLKRK